MLTHLPQSYPIANNNITGLKNNSYWIKNIIKVFKILILNFLVMN